MPLVSWRIKAFAVGAVCVLWPMLVHGQTTDSGAQLEQQRQREQRDVLPRAVPTMPAAPEPKKSADSRRLNVVAFRLSGTLTVFTPAEVQQWLSEHTGQLSLAQLHEVLGRITQRYRERGYFLAQVFLPPQDVTDGTIEIRIEEGHVESVEVRGKDLRLDADVARRMMSEAVAHHQPLRRQDLERGVLLLSDLPGLSASANLEPGSAAGSTRVLVDVTEGPRVNSRVGLDNTGGRLTGVVRATAAVDLNDLSGWGEQTSVYLAQSSGDGNQAYMRLGYGHPLGSSGLRGNVAYHHLRYVAGKEFASLESYGSARNWSADLSYPLVRSRLDNVVLQLGWDGKRLLDGSAGSVTNDRRLRGWRLGLNVAHARLPSGYTQGGVTLHSGTLDLALAAALAADQAVTGPQTQGHFRRVSYNLRHMERGFERLALIADIHGQWSNRNLGSSEKFQLGGPYGIRAYPGGEGSGDQGLRFSLEARYLLHSGAAMGDWRVIGFYDWGRIQQWNEPAMLSLVAPNRYNLSGYGVGLQVGKPADFELSLVWAQRIGTNPAANPVTGANADGSTDRNRLWGTVQVSF